jgi:hypothetical protein
MKRVHVWVFCAILTSCVFNGLDAAERVVVCENIIEET